MKSFNMNHKVYVKLTDKGKEVLKNHYRGEFHKPDENGYYSFQFWVFMNIFGEYVYNGAKPVIEMNNLYFKEEDLIDSK